MKPLLITFILVLVFCQGHTQKKELELFSPDGRNKVKIQTSERISWSVWHNGVEVLQASPLSIQFDNNSLVPGRTAVQKVLRRSVTDTLYPVAYKKASIPLRYNELELVCKGNYSILFRAANEGVAYRFVTRFNVPVTVKGEEVDYNFAGNKQVFIPFTSDLRQGERYSCSFEEFYHSSTLSALPADSLGYLPMLVQLNDSLKVALLEADVQDYPAMFIEKNNAAANSLKGVWAPYPATETTRGKYGINYAVTKRESFIAQAAGSRAYPWRVLVITEKDKELLNNDMVQQFAEPSKITDPSWIKPGKVAWDWWNDWNITGVDFKAGINTPTYKYYIDFASRTKIEYVVLDEGWSDDWDLYKLNKAIDLPELLRYAQEKNTGIILWTTWYALSRDIEGFCKHYAAMGVKGFKVDFIDRNDQKAVASCYEIASIAAKYKLLLDFHGMFAPQGLQVTWPNVVNFEGVRGMEYMKWSADDRVTEHAVRLPFIRMLAGPMDYTPGAFRNRTRKNAQPSNSLPQSLGTRCNQLAMYIAYEAPLQMLADNPTIYTKEQECTDFIAGLPTSFDETIALDGKFGEYLVIARRKGKDWFISGMSNWTSRDIIIDLSFLPGGTYGATVFRDGLNADRDATDYIKETWHFQPGTQTVHMAPGGGFVIHITESEK